MGAARRRAGRATTRLLESLLVRIGVADHTARLLAATPVLRRSWLAAVALVLLMAVVATDAGRAASPTLFLALAPLLPLAGVALSYGPVLDPTYEMAVVSPLARIPAADDPHGGRAHHRPRSERPRDASHSPPTGCARWPGCCPPSPSPGRGSH